MAGGGIGSVIFGWILWRYTGNIWLAAIIAVVTWPILSALFNGLLQLPLILLRSFLALFEPETPLTVFKRSEAVDGTGLRILLAVQGEFQFSSVPEEREKFEKALSTALESLRKNDSVFKFKYAWYLNNKPPLEIYAAGYKRVLNKVFGKMKERLSSEGFDIGDDGRDVFYYEGRLPKKNEKDAEPTVRLVFVFDKTIPAPEPASEAAPAVETGAAQGPSANLDLVVPSACSTAAGAGNSPRAGEEPRRPDKV